MIAKFSILLFTSACLAFPAEEGADPPQAIFSSRDIPPLQGILPPQDIPAPQEITVPIPEGQQNEGQLQDDLVAPPQGPAEGQLENSDLKTDSSFWYRRHYYPIYRRHYYRPRTYNYYPYYWNSWW